MLFAIRSHAESGAGSPSRFGESDARSAVLVQGLEFRVWGLGSRVQGLGFRVKGLGFRIWGLGFVVLGLFCWGWVFEFRVLGFEFWADDSS